MDLDVIHEVGRHYVVRDHSRRPGRTIPVFSVRHQGIVPDKEIARIAGVGARKRAIAMADEMSAAERQGSAI